MSTYSRSRSQGGYQKSSPVVQKSFNSSGSLTGTYVWSPGTDEGSLESIQDTLTPNYAIRRKAGEIIMNDLDLVKNVVACDGSAHITYKPPAWNGAWVEIDGDVAGDVWNAVLGSYPLGSDVDATNALSLIRAYASLNSAPVLSGEIASSLHETVSMLRRPFGRSLTLLARMAKKRSWHLSKKSVTVAQANANTWLEYRYGWTPLIRDGISIMRESGKLRTKLDSATFVARGSAESSRSRTDSVTAVLYSAVYTCKGSLTQTEEVRSSSGILYRITKEDIGSRVSSSLGLRARDIPATLWEIVPYSFVADWFVSVGPWLEAITPRPDATVLGSWTTNVRGLHRILNGTTITRTSGSYTATGSLNSRSQTNDWVHRTKDPVLPSTPVVIPTPVSSNNVIDAIALSVGRISQLLNVFRH